MLGSFHDLIKPSPSIKIPKEVIAYFNTQVPKGYEYRLDEKHPDVCWLVSTGSKGISLENLKPQFTDKQIELLGDEGETPEGLELLLENCLEHVLVDTTNSRIGDSNLPVKYMARTADDTQMDSGLMFIYMEPKEFTLPLVCGKTRLGVRCVQKPSGDIHVSRFESIDCPLVMVFELNGKNLSAHYSFRFDSTLSESVAICRDAAIIYDGLSDGATEIEGVGPIRGAQGEYDGRHRLAPFWEKAADVQKVLGIEMHVNKPLDRETVANIERLYTCLCEDRAVGLGFKPDSITVTAEKAPIEVTGERCRLMFPSPKSLKLFDQRVEVYACVGLSGIILGKPDKDTKADNRYRYPVMYSDDYQCTILYCLTSETDDSEDNVAHISDILFAPLPDGRSY